MRVIGVVDLLGGVAVHARGGKRHEYQPIGDAVALARTYVDRHGIGELYVADLDAIERRSVARGTVERIAAIGVPVWLDAGISSIERARAAVDLGAAHAIVGLETLPSFDGLREICDALTSPRVAFSLDLHDSVPIGIGGGEPADQIATRAAGAGAGAIIVLDLARVGMRAGLDLELLARVRKAAPDVVLLAGGGVRGPEDLDRLADAGCDGALVATALRDGSLSGAPRRA